MFAVPTLPKQSSELELPSDTSSVCGPTNPTWQQPAARGKSCRWHADQLGQSNRLLNAYPPVPAAQLAPSQLFCQLEDAHTPSAACGLCDQTKRHVVLLHLCLVAFKRKWLITAATVLWCADNPLTIGLVTLLTETLRVLGVGQQRYEEVLAQPSQNQPVEPGDLPAIMQRIGADFEQGYIITGACSIHSRTLHPDCSTRTSTSSCWPG